MKRFQALLALALIPASALADDSTQWLPAGPNDLVASSLTVPADALPTSRHAESAPVRFSWAATSDYKPAAAAGSVQVESRQYWVDVSGRALEDGIKLPLSAPGAVIRVSALESGSRLQLDAGRMELELDGQPLARSAIETVATGRDLRAQGLPVPQDSLAFRLPQSTPGGSLQMRIGGATPDQPLVVHVYEPNSPWVAQLQANRDNFLSDEPIAMEVSLLNGARRLPVDQVNAMLLTPDAAQVMAVERAGDGFGLSGTVPAGAVDGVPGLYEAHAYVQHRVDGVLVKRDLKLAFGVAPAAGRFSGRVEQRAGGGLELGIGVEVVSAGRYQVNGEIFGTNALGQLQPLAFSQSAAVLAAGTETIELGIDQATLAASGLSAPYEVRNLQLLDQGRMYLLEQRARAVTIGPASGEPELGRRIER